MTRSEPRTPDAALEARKRRTRQTGPMWSRPAREPTVFTSEELKHFDEKGFVRLRGVFDPELASAIVDRIWIELAEVHGIEREDRSTWRSPSHSPRETKNHPLSQEVANNVFQGAISDLLGREDWKRPASWGGYLLTFPNSTDPYEVPTSTWHWDGPPEDEGLLIFSSYSRVEPGGGGTHVLAGSHRLVHSYYESLSVEDRARPHKFHRKNFASWDPWLSSLYGHRPLEDRVGNFVNRETVVRGIPCRVVELRGEPGDVVFCNLGLLHAAAANRSREPRIQRVKFFFLGESWV